MGQDRRARRRGAVGSDVTPACEKRYVATYRPRKEGFVAIVVDVAKGAAITVGLMVVAGIGYAYRIAAFRGPPPLRDLKPSDVFEPLYEWTS